MYHDVELDFMIAMVYFNCESYMQTLDTPTQQMVNQRVQHILSRFEILAANAPSNNEHKLLLMRAEQARLQRNFMDAICLYTKAAQSAGSHGFKQYLALS